MVNIPGKSKGCTTCRRRKKGVSRGFPNGGTKTTNFIYQCDQQRPFCNRCRLENYKCEGYKRPIIFVSHEPDRTNAGELVTIRPRFHNPGSGKTKGVPTKVSLYMSLAEEHLLQGAFDQNAWNASFEFILPSEQQRWSPDKAGSNPYPWVDAIMQLCTTSDTLRHTVRAVCLSSLGYKENNQDFIRKGTEFYGTAVSNLNQLIQRTNHADNVALIPIAMLLATYDVSALNQ
jgi:hypothetical protein